LNGSGFNKCCNICLKKNKDDNKEWIFILVVSRLSIYNRFYKVDKYVLALNNKKDKMVFFLLIMILYDVS
jgi:hypothetical protein